MNPLPVRRLGRNGPEITRVGFGAWAIGGGGWAWGWGSQDDSAAVAAMRHAVVEHGVNWIDTAAVYGTGHSEELVGQLLRELAPSERPFVFTKCGLVTDLAHPMKDAARSLEPASVRRECEASLRRLGVDTIDLFQFHRPDDATGTPVEDSWAEMMKLQDEGKVRWAGLSNFDVGLIERCHRLRTVDSFQPPLSMLRRQWAEKEIPFCAAHDIGVIAYGPMFSGLLTEKWTIERAQQLEPEDWRYRSPEFNPPAIARNLAVRDALLPIARKHRVSVGAVAVAWTLAWPGVTGAIVGARSPAQVDGWIAAAALVLDDEDHALIRGALQATGAGGGPSAPAGA